MKKSFVITAISLYGNIANTPDIWLKWFVHAEELMSRTDFAPNYIGVKSDSFKSGKALQLKRVRKRLLNKLQGGESVSWLSLYSLPATFQSVTFGYNALISRHYDYVTFILPKESFAKIDKQKVIKELSHYVDIESGEIFEMTREECPLIYISKANPPNSFNTLKVLQKL